MKSSINVVKYVVSNLTLTFIGPQIYKKKYMKWELRSAKNTKIHMILSAISISKYANLDSQIKQKIR